MRNRLQTSAQKAQQHALDLAIIPWDRPTVPATKSRPLPAIRHDGPLIVKARSLRRNQPSSATKRTRPAKSIASQDRLSTMTTTTDAQRKRNATQIDDIADYVDVHRREVGRFGSQALDKRNRRAYQTAQLVKLGCKPPKNPKMPIGLLQRVRQRQKQQQKEKKEMDIATGMIVRSRRQR